MNTGGEHNRFEDLFALFDGTLAPGDAESLRRELAADPACAEDLSVFDAIAGDLHAMGASIAGEVESVNLWPGIEQRLKDVESNAGDDCSFDRLLEFAEGRLNEFDAAKVRSRIDQSPQLAADYAWLTAVRDELHAMGDAVASQADSSVEFAGDVLSAVADELEDAPFDVLLDWRDGTLPLPDSERLRRLAETNDEVRAANEWLLPTANALETLGDRIAAKSRNIDIVGGVMATIERADMPTTPVTLDAERLRRRTRMRWASGLASAAMVTLAIGWVWFEAGPTDMVTPPSIREFDSPPSEEFEKRQNERNEKRDQMGPRNRPRLLNPSPVNPAPNSLSPTSAPSLDALSRNDIVDVRKKAAQTGDWSEFFQLATLKREEVLEIIEREGLNSPALVGLANSLLPGEEEHQLLQVVGAMPDSPYVHIALLETVVAQPPGEAQTEQPLAIVNRLSDLDPKNALPYYLEAKMHLDNGQPELAIAALLEAQALDYANPYSLEAAAYREEALIASGMNPEAAEMLAAFNAGVDEYDALMRLATDLLDYGNYFNELGDPDTTRVIYESVQSLGQQIEASAVLSQEQLVGLDIQSAAIDVLGQFYQAHGLVEELNILTEQSIQIIEDLEGLNVFFGQLNTMLVDITNPVFWNNVARVFTEEGDLVILNYLQEWGIPLETN
jgi:tetratricopeptide (TPR) repeat protein